MSAAKSRAEEWHAPSGEHGHRSFLIRPRSPLEGQYHHLRFLFPHRIQFDHDHHWRPASPFTFLSLSLILIGHDCHRFCANLLTIVYCHDIAPPSLYIGSLRLHCDGDITHTCTLLLVHLLYCHTPAKRTLLVVAVLPPLSLILREPIDYRLLPRYRAPITLYW